MEPRSAADRPAGDRVTGRVRETGRLYWGALSRTGRVSAVGVVVAGVLILALGATIPSITARREMGARLEDVASMVRALERQGLIPRLDPAESAGTYAQLETVIRQGLLARNDTRIKLWDRTGSMVYSSLPSEAGHGPTTERGLESALGGRPDVTMEDLSSAQSPLNSSSGSEAIEFFIPLRDGRGGLVGVIEIYQDAGPTAAQLAATRSLAWRTVGASLALLLALLALSFLSSAGAMARGRRAEQDRADDLAVLLRVSRILCSEPGIDRTGPEVLELVAARLGLRCAAAELGDRGTGVIWANPGRAAVCHLALQGSRAAREEGSPVEGSGAGDRALGHDEMGAGCAVLAVPLPIGEGRQGAFVACREASRPFGPREHSLIEGVAVQLGVAAQNAALVADLREMTEMRGRLLRRLVDAQEEERRQLVGDLHDGAGQTLTRVLYGIRGTRARLQHASGTPPAEVERELAEIEDLTDGVIVGLRRNLALIQPQALDELGLSGALKALARTQGRESGIRIEVVAPESVALDHPTAITLYRATQEAVMNARKHSGAHRVRIELARRNGSVDLEVADDGRGVSTIDDGIGLRSLKERVAVLGGTVEIDSRPGAGTTVRMRVPVGG